MSNEMTPYEAMAEAVRLLRDAADELHESHNAPGETTFDGEPEAQAAYEKHERVANALESAIAARLRGDGEQSDAVRALPAKWRDEADEDNCHEVERQVLLYCATDLEFALAPPEQVAALSTQPAPSEQVAASVAVPEGLIYRVEEAARRIDNGHAPRRIPAEPTDVDLVLGEVLAWLKGEPAPFWVPAAAPVAPEREG